MERRGKKYADPESQFVIHPDIIEANQGYDGTGRSFKEIFQRRDELLRQGEKFWNDDHDDELAQTAQQRTLQATMEGWQFPYPRKRD